MWKFALLVAAGVVVLVLAVVVSRPASFRVERSLTVAAPPEVVFAEVVDFHRWVAWSPWEELDPDMTRLYEGPAAGVGASYAWVGNDKVGRGRMTVISETTGRKVDIRLDFLKPWKATNLTEFTFAPSGEGTRVTWAMSGENGFAGKAMALFMDMDEMVGRDFEKGLSRLRAVAEAAARARASGAESGAAAVARASP